MTEAEIVTKYLEIKKKWGDVGYHFTLLNPDLGFTAYNDKIVYKFYTISDAILKYERLKIEGMF